MTGAEVKQKLHAGERVYGTHIASLMNPLAAAIATLIFLLVGALAILNLRASKMNFD